MLRLSNVLLFLLSQGFFEEKLALTYDIEKKGWRMTGNDTLLSLTWTASGATWRSPLLAAVHVRRFASVRNGCWDHNVKQGRNVEYSVVQSATWSGGQLHLQGEIPLPSLDREHPTVEPWEMRLTPSDTGKISFVINIGNASSARSRSMSGATDVEKSRDRSWMPKMVYRYSSVDISLLWFLEADERIVGAGEQYSTVDLKGQTFQLWSGEQGIGRDRQPITKTLNTAAWPCGGSKFTTYSAVPALLSTRGYGVVLENTQLVAVDLRTDTAEMSVSFEDRPNYTFEIAGHILGGSGVRGLLDPLTSVTGRMDAPPKWISDGFVVGTSGGYKAVDKHIDALLAADVPVVGVWIQDWSGMVLSKNGEFVWWNWVLDETRYPKQWFRDLSARGIRVMTYINPFLTTAHGSNGKPPEIFLEAKRLGHLITDETGEPLIEKVAFADFTYGTVNVMKEESRKWWAKIMRCNVMMACDGGDPLVFGWMNDYGEYLPLTAYVSSAEAHQELASDVHNRFGRLHAAAAREASEGFPNVTFFSRSGDLHSPGVSRMFWLGDQLANYDACDGIQSAVIGAMSGGLSGWTITGADVGAFTIVDRVPWLRLPGIHFTRSTQQMIRWLELCVFLNALYRSHMGLLPDKAAQPWDDDVISYTKVLTNLFRDLAPYRDFLYTQATQAGLPLVRHGLLVFPEDSSWFNKSADWSVLTNCVAGNEIGLSQFFLGDDVLVAPVYDDSDKVHVYLSRGSWVHFWTRKQVEGPSYDMWSSPLGQPAFFFRAPTSNESSSWGTFFQTLARKYSNHSAARSQMESLIV